MPLNMPVVRQSMRSPGPALTPAPRQGAPRGAPQGGPMLGGSPGGGGALESFYPPPPYEAPPGYPISGRQAMWADMLTNVGDVIAGRPPSSPHMRNMQGYHLQAQKNAQMAREAMQGRYETMNVGGQVVRVDRMTGAVEPLYEGPVDKQREYEFARRNGFEGTYDEFLRSSLASRDTAPSKNFNRRQQLVEQYGENSPQVRTFDEYVRAGSNVDLGGGGVGRLGAGGDMETVVSPEAATERDARAAAEKVSAEDWSRADVAFESESIDAYENLQGQLQTLERIEEDIESGRIDDTGYFEGVFTPYLNEAEAELRADSTMATLEALQMVNLAPVTEQEFGKLEQLFPNVRNNPRANLGIIRAARRRLRRALQRMETQMDYFYDQGTLQGFSFRDRPPRRSPTSAESVEVELPEGFTPED